MYEFGVAEDWSRDTAEPAVSDEVGGVTAGWVEEASLVSIADAVLWPDRSADANDALAGFTGGCSMEALGATSDCSEVAARASARGSSCVILQIFGRSCLVEACWKRKEGALLVRCTGANSRPDDA